MSGCDSAFYQNGRLFYNSKLSAVTLRMNWQMYPCLGLPKVQKQFISSCLYGSSVNCKIVVLCFNLNTSLDVMLELVLLMHIVSVFVGIDYVLMTVSRAA